VAISDMRFYTTVHPRKPGDGLYASATRHTRT
jgi:hypothetical protein